MSGSFAERDLHLKASYEAMPSAAEAHCNGWDKTGLQHVLKLECCFLSRPPDRCQLPLSRTHTHTHLTIIHTHTPQNYIETQVTEHNRIEIHFNRTHFVIYSYGTWLIHLRHDWSMSIIALCDFDLNKWKLKWNLSLPQTSRANPVQCCSTHQKRCAWFNYHELNAFYDWVCVCVCVFVCAYFFMFVCVYMRVCVRACMCATQWIFSGGGG